MTSAGHDIAAKGDIFSFRADLRETELRLKAEIKTSTAEIVNWMVALIGLQTVVVVGAMIALSRAVQP